MATMVSACMAHDCNQRVRGLDRARRAVRGSASVPDHEFQAEPGAYGAVFSGTVPTGQNFLITRDSKIPRTLEVSQ